MEQADKPCWGSLAGELVIFAVQNRPIGIEGEA